MITSISNSYLTVAVKQRGAELCSIKSKGGTEYIWQADPEIWGRHAPILFPIVGKLANNIYSYGSNRYEMTQHGFARDKDFELAEENGDSLSYRLLPSAGTRQMYPFEFVLLARFRLQENSVQIEYEIKNNGNAVMPFSIGAHPAFNLRWGNDDAVTDYFLKFEKSETLVTRLLGRDNLLSDATERVLDNGNILPLRKDMFDRDALIFLDMKSEKITLCSHRHKKRLTVEFPGFRYLGIWAKPGAPFVCIEPWHGYADPEKTDGILMNKPGIIRLEPGASFFCAYRTVVEE